MPSPEPVSDGPPGIYPLSVLRADRGPWRERRRSWADLGLTPDVGRAGREGTTTFSFTDTFNVGDFGKPGLGALSTFDPVLAEVAYTWFCPPRGRVLDPFAGGATRGLVAANLGYSYRGIDISGRQVAANDAVARDWQRRDLVAADVDWIHADAADALPDLKPASFDFLFTCPPYGNLERYSDHPRDLSAMRWRRFAAAYTDIIGSSVERLAPNRFATFVVGEIRRHTPGYLRGLVPLTIDAFAKAGAHFYNDMVLINAIGTAAARLPRPWRGSRKMARHHQYVLTFVKGDPATAAAAITSTTA